MADAFIERVQEQLGGRLRQLCIKNSHRVYCDIDASDLREAARILHEGMGARFSTATGIDTFQGIEILYHFSFDAGGVFVTLRVLLTDKAHPVVDSLTSLGEGFDWIEREIHELLGVDFTGHPNLTHLLLVDEWPEGCYPLRKDCLFEKGPGHE